MKGAYYNENDEDKAAWLRELIREGVIAAGEVDTRSIAEVWPEDLAGFAQCHFFAGIGVWSYALRLAGWPDDRPVWTGSCPCPSFSAAGKGAGFDDPRHLWPDWARLIRKCRPATLFGEQADDAIGYGWLDLVQTDLEREDYAVGKAVLGACSVGAPHIRQRLYFVAHSQAAEAFSRLREIQSGAGTHYANGFGNSNADDRLDDTASARCDAARQGTEREARNDSRMRGPESGCASGRLEFSDRSGRTPRESSASPNRHGSTAITASAAGELEHATQDRPEMRRELHGERGRLESGDGCNTGELADSDRRGQPMHGTTQRETGHTQRGGEGNLGESLGAGLERHSGDGEVGHESRWFGAQPDGPVAAAGFVNGFWRGADWVLRKRWNSEDWEWCPTEPGTFPLVAGASNRVLKLRGYGDAICAEVAKAFIEASALD